MYSFIHRLIFFVTSIVLCFLLCSVINAEPIRPEQAFKATDTFLRLQSAHPSKGELRAFSAAAQGRETTGELNVVSFQELYSNDGTILAFVADMKPRGFVVTSSDTDIHPIVAYSFKSSFPGDQNGKNPLYRLLTEDMKLRAKALAELEKVGTLENNNLWNFYTNEDTKNFASDAFQQWPQEDATSTGGWLETTWEQGAPYNKFCPLDPVDAKRSYVGCVATAMAQVLNYHRQCNVQFDEYDSYITYAGVNIDDDCNVYDFPSFEKLNEYINDLRIKYSRQEDLNDTDTAALSFACGVAIFMDYSSEGSGATSYDMQDALLDRFGLHSADMTGGLSCEYYHVLQENIINQLPTILAIRPTDGWGGHLVVCDGYNTTGEYHINFGWGSNHPNEITEAWYHLPSDLPSSLSIISEAILNVQPVAMSIDVDPASLLFYSVPAEESAPRTLFIKNNSAQLISIDSISSPEGFIISRTDDDYSNYIGSFQIQRPGQEASINVKFCPDEARGYYGTLKINYGQGKAKHVILKGCSFSGGTDIHAGEVSGKWSEAQSPYFIYGDISIAEDEVLVVEPGVKVMFLGPYSLTIGENAQLTAEGDEIRPIEFTALNKDMGWTGLRFIDSGDDDILSHCLITFSKKGAGLITDYFSEDGNEDIYGGAVYCYASSPIIANCKIANNLADKAGAIYSTKSYPIVSNTVIANNASMGGSQQCGGIFTESWGAPEIKNCTIVNNTPGGIFTTSGAGVDVTNTILWGNERYQIQTDESVPVVSFCNVQGGYTGQGNIDADPCFFAPSSGVGIDYDALSANWTLQSCSPCINCGTQIELPQTDLAGSPRIHSDVIDIGAYENQSDLPLITVTSSVDAGCVLIDMNSTVSFDVTNTGKMDFKLERLGISDAHDVFTIVTPITDYPLAPGDSTQVEISFSPAREKIYTAIVHIYSNSSNAPHKRIAVRGVGVSGTVVPAGSVSGTWTKKDSPYSVTGDIYIPRGRSLTIEPGVVVNFTGHYGLTVGYRATLRATGTETENIIFTPIDTDEGWFGIRLVNSGSDDTLKYCTIEYSKKPTSTGTNYLDLYGGGILCCSSGEAEPMFDVPSSPTIDHCIIANNYAACGGGIFCMDESEAVITNSTIVDNSADLDVGGILIYNSSVTIVNNIIAHNSGSVGGGIVSLLANSSIINNTIVNNRPNGLYMGETFWFLGPAKPVVLNNVIWQNEVYVDYYVWPGDYVVNFNNIQGGFQIEDAEEDEVGIGNIDVDPLFADPNSRDYHLKSQAGRWDIKSRSWIQDDITSPCIDAGDPNSEWTDEPSPNGERINMGAYGGTAEASMSVIE